MLQQLSRLADSVSEFFFKILVLIVFNVESTNIGMVNASICRAIQDGDATEDEKGINTENLTMTNVKSIIYVSSYMNSLLTLYGLWIIIE